MGFNVGMPVLGLKRGYGKGKHAGNAQAVASEALSERFSSDADLDRSRTKYNTYVEGGFTSGKELADYWTDLADEYRVIDKNGKEKKLRSDATIGCAIIIKPDSAYMATLSEEERDRLLNACDEVLDEIMKKRGCELDAGVRHKDEISDHDHRFYHDPNYKMSKIIGLKLFNQLNKEFPKKMRERGFDVNDLQVYDAEAVKAMTPEEAEAYKADVIAKKKQKKHGLSSRTFKENQIAYRADALAEKEKTLDLVSFDMLGTKRKQDDKERELEEKENELGNLSRDVMSKKRRQDDKEKELEEKENALAEKEAALDAAYEDIMKLRNEVEEHRKKLYCKGIETDDVEEAKNVRRQMRRVKQSYPKAKEFDPQKYAASKLQEYQESKNDEYTYDL